MIAKTTGILGYGEDALTYWALSTRLDEFLKAVGDGGRADDALVIYRPSFGRRGGGGSDGGSGAGSAPEPRAEFGEFDAIVGTQTAVYLVESKWDFSPETLNHTGLREVQRRRHRIFRWYLDAWRESAPDSWVRFTAERGAEFAERFPGGKIAPAESKLAQNLEFVLTTLSVFGAPIVDILLYLCQHPEAAPRAGTGTGLGAGLGTGGPDDVGFRQVTIPYEPLTRTGYIAMGG